MDFKQGRIAVVKDRGRGVLEAVESRVRNVAVNVHVKFMRSDKCHVSLVLLVEGGKRLGGVGKVYRKVVSWGFQ